MARVSKKKSDKTKKAPVLVPEIVLDPDSAEEALDATPQLEAEPAELDLLSSEALAKEETLSDLPIDELPASPSEEGQEDEEPKVTERHALVSRDPLEAYLREIAQHTPLTREKEHELAVKYLKDKDRQAAYKLVVSNLWLVVKIARDYERAARNLLDLVQEGNIGLMEAVKNFDPYRGVRFPSYATWWIKAYIIRYLIANWRMVKIGTTQAQRKLFFNLKKEREKLEREGFFPAPKLLAERLSVKESDVIEMDQRLGSADVSVDAPVNQGEDESTLLNVLPSQEASAEEVVGRRELQRLLVQGFEEFQKLLPEREQYIFTQRILNGERTTLQEVSEKLDISRERVRQIEERLRKKLRDYMRERLGDHAPTEIVHKSEDRS